MFNVVVTGSIDCDMHNQEIPQIVESFTIITPVNSGDSGEALSEGVIRILNRFKLDRIYSAYARKKREDGEQEGKLQEHT